MEPRFGCLADLALGPAISSSVRKPDSGTGWCQTLALKLTLPFGAVAFAGTIRGMRGWTGTLALLLVFRLAFVLWAESWTLTGRRWPADTCSLAPFFFAATLACFRDPEPPPG